MAAIRRGMEWTSNKFLAVDLLEPVVTSKENWLSSYECHFQVFGGSGVPGTMAVMAGWNIYPNMGIWILILVPSSFRSWVIQ
jgi:hypothetical protein